MIWGLKGKVRKIYDNSVAIDTGGVIYKAFVSQESIKMIPAVSQEIELFTVLIVKEDALDIFGFISEEEKNLFEVLNTVNGVGPRAALAILSSGPVNQIKLAISQGKTEALTKSFGIGKKTAERIVIDLRDKVFPDFTEGGESKAPDWDEDVFEALMKLGYKRELAKEAVKNIDFSLKTTNDRLRDALKKIK